MNDWLKEIGSRCQLPERALQELLDSGFTVIPGPVASKELKQPRRSIQGAYIRRDAEPSINQRARLLPQTRARIGPLSEYLLAV